MSLVQVSVAGGVATVTIDAPPINLMTVEMFKQLSRAIEALSTDDAVQVVVLRSANPEWFIAHFDVEAILTFPTDVPAVAGTETATLNNFHRMCEMLRTMPKATIAVVEGRIGGGGSEVALSCDMRFATPDAIFNQPEVAIGLIPGGSGTVRLPRLIGRSRALEVILGCDDIDAATAERWGWVNRVLPADQIDGFVGKMASRIARFPRAAVIAAKKSVLLAEAQVTEDLLVEGDLFNALLSDPQGRVAMAKFLTSGGQTPEGERRLGKLAGELAGELAESG